MMKLFNKKSEKNENIIKNNRKITEKELVGKNYQYFEPLFEEFKKNNNRSWNLPALIIAPYWYIYRKMTYTGALIIGIQVILATLAYFLRTPVWICLYVLSFLIYVRTAFYGNHDYYKRIMSLKKESESIDDKYKDRFLKDKSGVDVYMTVCWIVGSILIYILALFL